MAEDTKPLPKWFDKDEFTWTYKKPFKDSTGGLHTEITAREPTMGELDKAMKEGKVNGKQDDVLEVVALIKIVSGKTDEVVRALPIRIFKDVSAYLLHFQDATLLT